MRTAEELMKMIDDNIDDEYWIAPYIPKKCVLNNYWDLVDIPGYVVEIYARNKENTMYL